MIRKTIVLILLLMPFTLAGGFEENNSYVPIEPVEVKDFSAEAKLSLQSSMPILLLVSQAHCSFCMQIKEEILGPMIISGDYDGELLIRELFIDRGSQVRDFNGQYVDSGAFALRYNVYLTPTLLFIGPNGEELTERLVGIQTPEMFFFYVESAVEKAVSALRSRG